MLAVRGGDLYALGLLFQRHQARVHALCARLAGDAATADDLVQETFLRILRYRHTFKGDAKFTTWMYRIARNATLRHLERRSRRAEREAAAGRDTAIAAEESSLDPDRVARLEAGLAALPPDQREVLTLSRFHDLKYHEIADVCGCTVEAVKARIYRAMKTLRREMDPKERLHGHLRAEHG